MPKSSRTRPHADLAAAPPASRSRVADSSTRALSVISSRRWTGSRPVRARTSATEPARSRWATWRAERLTETSSGRRSGRSSCHSSDLPAGALLHPAPDRLDQAAVLGDRDELGRVEQAALGVLPADQRLEAGDLAAAEGDDRLVGEHELVALERVAQLLLELEPAQRRAPASPRRTARSGRGRFPLPGTSPRRRRGSAARRRPARGPRGGRRAMPMLAVMKCSTPPIT